MSNDRTNSATGERLRASKGHLVLRSILFFRRNTQFRGRVLFWAVEKTLRYERVKHSPTPYLLTPAKTRTPFHLPARDRKNSTCDTPVPIAAGTRWAGVISGARCPKSDGYSKSGSRRPADRIRFSDFADQGVTRVAVKNSNQRSLNVRRTGVW